MKRKRPSAFHAVKAKTKYGLVKSNKLLRKNIGPNGSVQ